MRDQPGTVRTEWGASCEAIDPVRMWGGETRAEAIEAVANDAIVWATSEGVDLPLTLTVELHTGVVWCLGPSDEASAEYGDDCCWCESPHDQYDRMAVEYDSPGTATIRLSLDGDGQVDVEDITGDAPRDIAWEGPYGVIMTVDQVRRRQQRAWKARRGASDRERALMARLDARRGDDPRLDYIAEESRGGWYLWPVGLVMDPAPTREAAVAAAEAALDDLEARDA